MNSPARIETVPELVLRSCDWFSSMFCTGVPARHCLLYGWNQINLDLHAARIVNNRLSPFVYPSSCALGDRPSTTGPHNDRPLMTSLPGLKRFTGADQKQTTLTAPLMLRRLCVRVRVLTAPPPKLGGGRRRRGETKSIAARRPMANGRPAGPSLPATHSNTRGATRERPLANLGLCLLTRMWSCCCSFPLLWNKREAALC